MRYSLLPLQFRHLRESQFLVPREGLLQIPIRYPLGLVRFGVKGGESQQLV